MILYEAPSECALSLAELSQYHTTELKTWIGGTRGRQEDWSEPRNWFPHGVPTAKQKVVLGGYGRHRCIIKRPVSDISGLSILPGANLIIELAGRLSVDGQHADPLGFLGDSGLHIGGILRVKGALALRSAALYGIYNEGLFINEGSIIVDASISNRKEHWGRFTDSGERKFLLPG